MIKRYNLLTINRNKKCKNYIINWPALKLNNNKFNFQQNKNNNSILINLYLNFVTKKKKKYNFKIKVWNLGFIKREKC